MNPRSLNFIGSAVGLAVIAGVLAYAFTRAEDRAPTVAPPAPTAGAVRPPPAGTHPAPIELFASSRLGDWYAYRVVRSGTLGEARSTALVWISAATAQGVTRAVRGRIDGSDEERTGRSEEFPRVGLSLETLTGAGAAGWTLFDVTISDDVRVVGTRPFRCKKISYGSTDPVFPRKRTRTELWISAEVPAGGLVAERALQELDAMRFESTLELIGYGTATATGWGERPAGW